MDKLEELLKSQKELDAYIADMRGLEYSSDEWIVKKSTALLCEVSELLDEANYKWWKNPKTDNRQRVKEEIVDVLHFFLGICNDAGITADELYNAYMIKNEENRKRQRGESDKPGYAVKD